MPSEEFRAWNPKGILNVKYKDGKGNTQTWSANQTELLDRIKSIIDQYIEQKITLTNRQLYYQLVAGAIIPNAIEVYKRICTFLTDARYGGHIDWNSIEDRGRVVSMPSQWPDIKSLVESAVYAYRKPRWEGQDCYVEMFCEKDALRSVLEPIANRYHIMFGSNKGYSSAATMYELAMRVKKNINAGKNVHIEYFGDCDPSGLDMVRDIDTRIIEFLENGDDPLDPDEIADCFQVDHLALQYEQVELYRPPPNPAKVTDPRAKQYIAKIGTESWELDALKPELLKEIAIRGITRHLDIEMYNAIKQEEKEEIEKLKEFAETLVDGSE